MDQLRVIRHQQENGPSKPSKALTHFNNKLFTIRLLFKDTY